MSAQTQPPQQQRWIHGKAIQDHKVRFLSASALQKADASTSVGCLRSWWYAYVGGLKEPPTPAMERGTQLHAEIEKYLTTGERGHLSSLALSGLHMVPEPGPDLLVEHSLVPIGPSGEEDLSLAPVRIVDTPILGKIDLMHARRQNKGAGDVEDTLDPEGTIEVVDWKSTSSLGNIKASGDLINTIQMSLYGKYVFAVAPDTKLVRLSHGYFPMKGRPCKVTERVDQEDVERAWKRTLAVGVSIRDAARESNPDKIDANTRACRAYGRDCPARAICRAASHNSLASLVGSAADRLVPRRLPVIQPSQDNDTMTTPIAPNNLIARLNASKQQQQSAAPPPAITAPPPTLTPTQAEVSAEVARLQAIEAASAGTPAANPLLALIAEIESHGLGFPQLSGEAAKAVAAAKGIKLSLGAGLAGTGELGMHAIDSVDALPEILAGVKEIVALRAEEAKNAPPAAEQVVAETATEPEAKPDKKKSTRKSKKKDAEAQQADHVAETVGAGVTNTVNITYVAPSAQVNGNEQIAAAIDEIARDEAPPPAPTPQPPGAINVYVDVVSENLEIKSLWPLVHYIQQNMNADSGAADFRMSEGKDSRYGFGKWRSVLAACLRDCPSKGLMPPGNYRLDGSMGEIGGVVAETMREIALATGGVFVKGAR